MEVFYVLAILCSFVETKHLRSRSTSAGRALTLTYDIILQKDANRCRAAGEIVVALVQMYYAPCKSIINTQIGDSCRGRKVVIYM